MGFFKKRYWSDAEPCPPCLEVESMRPFLVMTKEIPIMREEETASMRPTYLSCCASRDATILPSSVLDMMLDVCGGKAGE